MSMDWSYSVDAVGIAHYFGSFEDMESWLHLTFDELIDVEGDLWGRRCGCRIWEALDCFSPEGFKIEPGQLSVLYRRASDGI